jgi:hypothetical protein
MQLQDHDQVFVELVKCMETGEEQETLIRRKEMFHAAAARKTPPKVTPCDAYSGTL